LWWLGALCLSISACATGSRKLCPFPLVAADSCPNIAATFFQVHQLLAECRRQTPSLGRFGSISTGKERTGEFVCYACGFRFPGTKRLTFIPVQSWESNIVVKYHASATNSPTDTSECNIWASCDYHLMLPSSRFAPFIAEKHHVRQMAQLLEDFPQRNSRSGSEGSGVEGNQATVGRFLELPLQA